ARPDARRGRRRRGRAAAREGAAQGGLSEEVGSRSRHPAGGSGRATKRSERRSTRVRLGSEPPMRNPRRIRVSERRFLNLPGYHGGAYVLAYVEDTTDRASANGSGP